MRSVTHLDEITHVLVPNPLALGKLIHLLVGCLDVSDMSPLEKTCGLDELLLVTVPRTSGARVVPTLTASANGARATLEVNWLWSSQTTISIRSLAADLAASIFEQGVHMEPVTSSISDTSTFDPPLPPTLSSAVAVVFIWTQP